MDKLEAFRLFVQVVDAGSFTKGARRSNLCKSALSQKIQRLEKALNVKLLHRNTRQIGLTPEGEELYKHVLPILTATEAIEDVLAASRSGPRGLLRVHLRANTAKLIVLPNISTFLGQHPGIQFELCCSDRELDLVANGIDCALRGGPIRDESMVAVCIGETKAIYCASPVYLGNHPAPRTMADLGRHEVVLYRDTADSKYKSVEDFLYGQTFAGSFRRTHFVDDVGVQIAAAKLHLGIVYVVEDLVRDELATGALVRVLPQHEGPAYPMHLIYPASRHLPQRVRVFIDWVRDLFHDRLAGPPGERRD